MNILCVGFGVGLLVCLVWVSMHWAGRKGKEAMEFNFEDGELRGGLGALAFRERGGRGRMGRFKVRRSPRKFRGRVALWEGVSWRFFWVIECWCWAVANCSSGVGER